MDGSDKGRKPSSGRSPAAKPAASRSTSGVEAPRSAPPERSGKSDARPVQGIGAPRTQSDDDDPFGIGSAAVAGDVIQALSKPEKGRLHRVVCPMCERPGFIARSAVGKQIRCANEKCMVPVFIAPDPDAPPVERAPRRRAGADTATEARTAGSTTARNKLIVYGVGGIVLLGLTIGLVQFLNRPPAVSPELSQPAPRPAGGYGVDPAEEAAAAAQAAEAARKAAANSDPREIAGRLARRMIQSARLPSNRDKALARRMTGDIFLRLGQPTEAAQEFNQLLAVNRQAGYYQFESRLASYWRNRAAGDAATAKSDFEQLRREAGTIPSQGRPALEAALGMAAALVAEGGLPAAVELVQKQQKDPTIVANVDGIRSGVWFFTAARLRDIGHPPFAAADVYAWHDPLLTAVTVDLACHRQWGPAIAWIQTHQGKRESADSLAILAELAASSGASDEDLAKLQSAADAAHPQTSLRVRSVIAAERKNAAALEAIGTAWSALPPLSPIALPGLAGIMQLNLPELEEIRLVTEGQTEYARAAILCEDHARAEVAIRQLFARFQASAPATAEIRRLAAEFQGQEAQIRKRITEELRVESDADITSAFRNYRRRIDSLTSAAEDRRMALIRSLSRIIRSGGVKSLLAVLEDPAGDLRREIFVDDTAGLLAAAAIQGGFEFPVADLASPDLKVALPPRSAEIEEIRVAPLIVQAWLLTRQGRPADAAVRLETATTDLPGLREVAMNEMLLYAAARVTQPAPVYEAVGKLRNAGWRERILEAASRQLAVREFEKPCEEWIESQTSMPGTEEVMAFYGIARALIDRLQSASGTSSAAQRR